MSAARYRNFFRLCEAWPADPTKPGRDLAVVIRQKVADAFKMGENTAVADPAKCDRDYEILHRLSTDFYRNKYKGTTAERTTGASGLSYEECHAVMSTEALKQLQSEELGFFTKLRQTFTSERPQ